MSLTRLTGEQPPSGTDPKLSEWLTRQIILINASMDSNANFTPTGVMPTKVEYGMCRYFNRIILPNITSPGPWMYVEGTWRKITA